MAETKTLNVRLQQRYDTAENWKNSKIVLLAGEMAVESDTGKFKFGDGSKIFSELDYAGIDQAQLEAIEDNYYSITVTNNDSDSTWLATIVGPKKGDIAVLKRVIDGNKTSMTAFMFDGANWCALDGNYNASNVYFDKNIQVTQSVGNITTSNNAPVDLEFKGKNMEQIWQYLYATEDTNIAVDAPSASISLSSTSTSKEVGESYDLPTASVSTSTGKLKEYGGKNSTGTSIDKSTNLTDVKFGLTLKYTAPGANAVQLASATDATSIAATSVPAASKPASMIVTDSNIVHKFNGTYSHNASAFKPVTNLGNFVTAINSSSAKATSSYDSGAAAFAEKSATAMSEKTYTVSGYRYMFAGATSAESLTSAIIRAFEYKRKHSDKPSTSSYFEFTAPAGATKVVFAYPSTVTGTPKFEMFGLAWAGNDNFTAKDNISVADYRGTNEDGTLNGATAYKIYSWELDTPLAAAETKFRVYF